MEDILTPEQLAQRLQVNPFWVYEQTRDRAGPAVAIRFRTSRWAVISDLIGATYSLGLNATRRPLDTALEMTR